VIILTRSPEKQKPAAPGIGFAHWDVEKKTYDPEPFRKARYLVNLAGAGVVDKRWTEERKKEILESRTHSCALLIQAMKEVPNQIESVASASAIGYYTESTGQLRVETDPPDQGFLGECCRLWEAAIAPVTGLGKRLIVFRTGIVLSNKGGAFPEFTKPVRFGLAAILGNGKQIVSWIHIDDMCRLYADALVGADWSGTYNAVAPAPVTNKTLMIDLAARWKGSFYLPVPVPGFLLKLVMGDKSSEVLKSSFVSAAKLKAKGFQFIFPTIDTAIRDLVPKD
jgi:uncharacterized protein (TIGR01777 family)